MQKLLDEWLKPDLRLPTGAVLLPEGATHARLWAEVGPAVVCEPLAGGRCAALNTAGWTSM